VSLRGWYWADPVVSFFISGIILYNAIPICTSNGRVLLQSVPLTIKDLIEKNVRDANVIDGVLEIRRNKTHFWTYSPGVFVGTVCVRVSSEANEQKIVQSINNIFSPFVKHLTIQVDKDDWVPIST